MNYNEASRLGDKAKNALGQLLWSYPLPMLRADLNKVHLRTARTLADEGLIMLNENYIDNDHWPPRPTRASDVTWEATLTRKGIQAALLLGYQVHPEDRCMVPSTCVLHTPFIENRAPVPVLEEEK